MAVILDGKAMSQQVMNEVLVRVDTLKMKRITPGLAVVLVGDDPASQTYVRSKAKACEKLGIFSRTVLLPKEATQEELEEQLHLLNADDKIDGILLQLPLPKHLNEASALQTIRPDKDVDGFHLLNAGRLFKGASGVQPCTPRGILYMLKSGNVPLSGKHAVVIGRSNIVGKPTALLLLYENCTVTICHSRTENLSEITKQADILVSAVGKPHFITADMVKDGAAVIDVGINRVDGKIVGDVDFDAVSEKAGFITPVPGGVGKMTIAMLMQNTVFLAEARL